MRSYCFIFNPASNRSRSEHVLDKIHDFISVHSLSATIHVISPQDRIKDIAQKAAEGHDVIVACGGDGTISAVVAGLLGTEAILGILPVGSGNDFVKSLGISKKLTKAFQVLLDGYTRNIDVGQANQQCFVNTLGIGFDGETNRRTKECRWLKGSPMYVWAALKSNFSFQPSNYRISFNDRVIDQSFLMITIANGQVEGGHFKVAPTASLFDGQFNLITLNPISPFILPFHLLRFMNGSHTKLDQVQIYETDQINIQLLDDSPKGIPIHADGEQVELTFPINITINKSALPVLCPET